LSGAWGVTAVPPVWEFFVDEELGVAVALGLAVSPIKRSPQRLQKTLGVGLRLPQREQVRGTGADKEAPQFLQYLISSRFWVAQCVQMTIWFLTFSHRRMFQSQPYYVSPHLAVE
jgi:hypothetical protein